ncbi:MAG: GNAT family N-acetyltransferase [Gaiellaceae bacterium]
MARSTAVVRPLGGHPEAAALRPAVAELIHEAGNPYFDWFFGDPQRAAATLAGWIRRPSSEVAASRVTLLLAGDVLAGAMVALSGEQLRRCRQADVVALLKDLGPDRSGRAALVERIQTANALFAPVGPEDFYLSKIGVLPGHRGMGLGRTLMAEFLAAGRAAGSSRFRLDVSADNEPAVCLYRSLGFVVESEGERAGLHYLSMVMAET